MKIAIVSKEAHAKSHARALQQEGHEVVLLGGNASQVPESCDIVVCRTASVSHTASEKMLNEKRLGRRPVVFANGVAEIVAEVRRLAAAATTAAVVSMTPGQPAPLPRVVAEPPKDVAATLQPTVETLYDMLGRLTRDLGAYCLYLHRAVNQPTVEAMARRSGKEAAIERWQKAVARPVADDRLRGMFRREAPPGTTRRTAWYVPKQGPIVPVVVWHTDDGAADFMITRLGFYHSEVTAKEARAKQLELTAAKGAAAKSALPAQPAPVSAPPVVETVVEPVVEPAVLAAPPAEPPAVKAWDDEFKAALGMVLAEMKSLGVRRVTIADDGRVDFERVVVTKSAFAL